MKTGTLMLGCFILSVIVGSLIYLSVEFNGSHILKVSKNTATVSVIEKGV